MNYKKAIQIQNVICEQFFFNRKNIEVSAGDYDEDPEPLELVLDIFSEVIAVNVIESQDKMYAIELLSVNKDLYLTPVLQYFKLDSGEIIATFSEPIVEQVKIRPLQIGCSIGPLHETWKGTLGCFVKDINNGEHYILSNHHVLFSNTGYKDNFISQPSNPDGGKNADSIGLYTRSLAPDKSGVNDFDAAIAGPLSDKFTKQIPGVGVNAEEFTNAILGMKVYKIGITTGKTFGRIVSNTSALKVTQANGDILDFQNQLTIVGSDSSFSTTRNFSLPGDSGSVIFDYQTNKAVGLLFSGNNGLFSFANNIKPLLAKLQVSLK